MPDRLPTPDQIDGPYASALPCTWVQDDTCVLGMWLVTGKTNDAGQNFFHPFWNQWVLSAIHLREYPGQPQPAIKDFPEATHELMVVALDPERGPYGPQAGGFHYLRPVNVRVQFTATDEQASHIPWLCARFVSLGRLMVEPEGIIGARELWATTIAQTIDHDRDPNHGRLN